MVDEQTYRFCNFCFTEMHMQIPVRHPTYLRHLAERLAPLLYRFKFFSIVDTNPTNDQLLLAPLSG
jgi:hypothetical protein